MNIACPNVLVGRWGIRRINQVLKGTSFVAETHGENDRFGALFRGIGFHRRLPETGGQNNIIGQIEGISPAKADEQDPGDQ